MIQKLLVLLTLLALFSPLRLTSHSQQHQKVRDTLAKSIQGWGHWEYGAIKPSTQAFVAGYNAQGAPLYFAMTRRGNHTVVGSYEASSDGASVITNDEPALAVPFKLLLGDFRTYPSDDGAFAAV